MNEELTEDQRVAFEVLTDVKEVLDELEIPFWLDGGTLLGFVRDGIFCVGDEPDVDVSTWCDFKEKKQDIIDKLFIRDYSLHGNWHDGSNKAHELSMRHKNGRHKIDIFFKERKGDWSWHCLYAGVSPAKWKRNPIKYFNNLSEMVITTPKGDLTYMIPTDYDGYLICLYNDWKTPVNKRKPNGLVNWVCYTHGNAFTTRDWCEGEE